MNTLSSSHQPFIQQRLDLFRGFPLLLLGPLEYGLCHLLKALDEPTRPLIWLELDPQDANDPTSQGNKLAEAVNKLEPKLLPQGMNSTYVLTMLEGLLSALPPLTFAITQAHYAPNLAKILLRLQHDRFRVIIQSDQPLLGFRNIKKYTQDDFRLSLKEASKLHKKHLDKDALRDLYQQTDGAYDTFLYRLHSYLNLPPPLVPGPRGPRFLPGSEPQVSPKHLLKLLVKQQRWTEALELAVEHLPKRVPEVLKEAGHAYHEKGLHKRLLHLLENLLEPLKKHESVLYWRLQAAFRLGQEGKLRKEVEAYLKENDAPELRALAAGVLMPTNPREALRAYQARATPFTAMQAGRLTDSKQSLNLLQQSVSLAERYGKPYEIPRNASILANKFLTQGHYEDAAHWFEWSLEKFEQLGIQDGQRKLLILNDWAYTKLYTGEVTGLEDILKQQVIPLANAYPDLAFTFSETMGDYFMATAQPGRALDAESIPMKFLALNTLNRVRALLELEESTQARKLAQRTLHLIQTESLHSQGQAHLAYGMAMSFQDMETSRKHLLQAQKIFTKHYHAPHLAQIALYLALNYMQEGKLKLARHLIRDTKSHIKGLAETGLRLLSGPQQIFRPIWNLLWEETLTLEIRFLGQQEIWLDGDYIKLFPQQLEVLAILASHQRPLTLEEILTDLNPNEVNTGPLKSVISKLRKKLPMISSHPYQITVGFQADFLEVFKHLQKGNLKAALDLYQGPLLKHSESPYLRELDSMIFESLRKAVLAQKDPELLLQLTNHVDDLEILEYAQPLLEQSDPRKALIQTKIEQLQKDWLN
jgi:tetratricopeptide (TPR) repeat protein